jgi:hypothetical protein
LVNQSGIVPDFASSQPAESFDRSRVDCATTDVPPYMADGNYLISDSR